MIKAQKHTLEWQLAQGKVAALTRELDFLIDVFYQIINMSTFVAGFGSLGIGVDMLDIYEKYGPDGSDNDVMWRKWASRVCVYLSACTLFLSLWVVCVVLSVVPNARRWALEGPVESVEDSVRKLKGKLNQVINAFTASLLTFIVERVANTVIFDVTAPVAPFMLITGGITLVLIGMEYKAAIREYSSDQLKYSHRAFPERPPEVYRELGRMKRMSTVLGSDGPFGPSMMTQGGGVNLLSHFRGKAPAAPSRLQLGAISRFDSPGGGPASPRREMNLSKLAVTSHHSWVDLTRVSAGKERGYTRRYGSVEAGVITLYCTYEDYILDVPSQSLALPLSSYKLAELSGDKEAALGMFELVPVVSHDGAWKGPDRHTYRFRPENTKGGAKWIATLRAALLALDDSTTDREETSPSRMMTSPLRQPRLSSMH